MASYFSRFFVALLILACSGCYLHKHKNQNHPAWTRDPYAISKNDEELAAVGVAHESYAGIVLQISQAEVDARANLASQIMVRVSRLTKDTLRSSGIHDPSQSPSNEKIEKAFDQVTQEIVNDFPLSGARRTNMWLDDDSKILFVRMVVDRKRVAEHLEGFLNAYDIELHKIDDIKSKKSQLFKDGMVNGIENMKFDSSIKDGDELGENNKISGDIESSGNQHLESSESFVSDKAKRGGIDSRELVKEVR